MRHKAQRNAGRLEESREGDARMLRTERSSHLHTLETILCVPSTAWGTLSKNNCLGHLWTDKMMTFSTITTKWYRIYPPRSLQSCGDRDADLVLTWGHVICGGDPKSWDDRRDRQSESWYNLLNRPPVWPNLWLTVDKLRYVIGYFTKKHMLNCNPLITFQVNKK